MSGKIERKIIIGLITSTEFCKAVRRDIDVKLFEATVAKTLALWILQYYDKFGKAPHSDIEELYMQNVKKQKIDTEIAEQIEEEILPGLSDEYIKEGLDDALVFNAKQYFKERKLITINEDIKTYISKGDFDKAEALINQYKPITNEIADEVILNADTIGDAVKTALTTTYEPLFQFGGALGEFINHQLCKDNFIAFLAPEKTGKTMMLMQFAITAASQGVPVGIIQAGDMSTNQMLRRFIINSIGKTTEERYVGPHFIPIKDCIKNQLNICDKKIRECNYGVFEDRGWDVKALKEQLTMDDLLEAYKLDPDYSPCYNCSEYLKHALGSPWLKQINIKMMTTAEADKYATQNFYGKNRAVRIRTFANGTCSVSSIREVYKEWKKDGFEPGLILIDYADLLVGERGMEERHKQNQVWKDLRGFNQETHSLLVTCTQSDADSYNRNLLSLKNYSEDKRKYAHATGFYGLNRDSMGREKKIGLMRINELLLRESDFESTKTVTVLQNLRLCRPIIGSYF